MAQWPPGTLAVGIINMEHENPKDDIDYIYRRLYIQGILIEVLCDIVLQECKITPIAFNEMIRNKTLLSTKDTGTLN